MKENLARDYSEKELTQAKIVYKIICKKNVGDIIKYEHFIAAGLPDILRTRGPVYTANIWFEKNEKKTLKNYRKVGYIVANAKQTLEIVKGRQKRSKRQVKKGIHTGENTNRTIYTREEFEELQKEVEQNSRILKAHENRLAAIERDQAIQNLREAGQKRKEEREKKEAEDRLKNIEAEVAKMRQFLEQGLDGK